MELGKGSRQRPNTDWKLERREGKRDQEPDEKQRKEKRGKELLREWERERDTKERDQEK